MQDRRVFERIAAHLPLRFFDLIKGKEGEAQTFDISAKGLGFLSRDLVSCSTPLEIWLKVQDKLEPLYMRGQVVWSERVAVGDQYRVGVNLERAELMGLSRALMTEKN